MKPTASERSDFANACEALRTNSRRELEVAYDDVQFHADNRRADIMCDTAQDALYEAGCGDATFGVSNGMQTAEFDRDATEFAEAVASAIKAVESAVPGARVVEVHRERDIAASS